MRNVTGLMKRGQLFVFGIYRPMDAHPHKQVPRRSQAEGLHVILVHLLRALHLSDMGAGRDPQLIHHFIIHSTKEAMRDN